MKKIVIAIAVAACAAIAWFFQDIREIHALYLYADAFKSKNIDNNFRSFYEQYPSLKIARTGKTYELPRRQLAEVMPEQYIYDKENRDISEWMQRTHTTGMAIMKDGQLIYENYFRGNTEDTQAIIMSVSKSMASMLIGVALEEGKIDSIEDPVTKYVPSLAGSAYDNGVTIKHVLQMSSGVRWDEDYGNLDSDLVRSVVATLLGSLDDFSATMVREHEPGSYNRYASIDTQVLGMIIREATGQSYQDYFNEKLWSKLGAEHDAYLMLDAVGEPLVYGGVNITLRDMVRFGQLYINNGKNFQNQSLVNAQWIKQSTVPLGEHVQPGLDNPQSDSGFGYGYQWWIPMNPDDDYAAIGIYGQFIYINPKRGIVIAKTSAYPNYTVDGGWMNHESLIAFQQIAAFLDAENKNNEKNPLQKQTDQATHEKQTANLRLGTASH